MPTDGAITAPAGSSVRRSMHCRWTSARGASALSWMKSSAAGTARTTIASSESAAEWIRAIVAIKSKELGLRPLAVHVDNGWNSEKAVGNIKRILDPLHIDLHTVVLNWKEFRELQLAFLARLDAGLGNSLRPRDRGGILQCHEQASCAVLPQRHQLSHRGNSRAGMVARACRPALHSKHLQAIHRTSG